MLGVVESRDRDGTYLKSLLAVERRPLAVLNANYDLFQLLEVRRMLEPRAAGLAAVRAGGRQISEIEDELIIQEAHPADHSILEKHDFLFHDAILRAAGNQVLYDIACVLKHALRRSRAVTAHTTPNIPAVVRQHRTIFNAIRLGQSELAERAMANHLETVGLDLISERAR
jgi:GntR family transcriptional repressor for pyruvate dehydrogenase complex